MSAHLEARAEESPEQSLSHKKTTELMASSARAFDVQVGTADMQNWSAAFTMAKALDTLVDEDHIYSTAAATRRLLHGQAIPHLTPSEADFVRSTYANLQPATQERWQYAASQLGAFALKRLGAQTAGDYIAVIQDESQLMADVLRVETPAATTETHANSDTRQRETFNIWLNQMAKTAYTADSLSDLVRDYNEGNISIKPTLKVAAELARASFVEFAAFTRITPPPVYAAIGKRAVTKTLEKVKREGFWTAQFVPEKRQ